MRIVIVKLPLIQGNVLLIDENGQEYPVYEEYSEIVIGMPVMLVFVNSQQVFQPVDPRSQFMDGGMYILVQLQGNELIIQCENNPQQLTWIQVN